MTGNEKSFENTKKVYEELKNYHKKWYSSDIMCLTILSDKSIKELGKMAISKFTNVKNKKVKTSNLWIK